MLRNAIRRDVDARLAFPDVFDGVGDEVLKQQHQQNLLCAHRGQGIISYNGPAFLYSDLKVEECFLKNAVAVCDNILLDRLLVYRPIVPYSLYQTFPSAGRPRPHSR